MPRPVPHCSAGPAALALWTRFSGQQKTTERAWKSGSVLYNFIDTKLNFDTNRLSAVCKHDICCTRAAAAAAADADSFRLTVNSSSSPVQHSSAKLSSARFRQHLYSLLSAAMLIAKRSIILFGADVAGDKSA